MKPKQKADRQAGEGRLKSTVGRHTRNPGWKAGRHWVLCQRCGLDYYDNEMKREWTGAIVCKSCWEPRHPQDFVRARRDRIAAPMPVNPDSLVTDAAVEGSTEIPGQTFAVGFTGALTCVSNQSDDSGTVISTVEVAPTFPTEFNDGITTWDVTAWNADGLPTGLTINSAGDITGTISGEGAGDYTPTVTATYGGGQQMSCTFDWTVAAAGASPEAIDELTASNWHIWLDFQDLETIWSDDEATTLITAGEEVVVRAVTNKSAGAEAGFNNTLSQPYNIASADTYAPVYDDSAEALDFAKINTTSGKTLQFGSGVCTASHPVDTGGMLYDDEVGGWTCITVAQQPTQQTEVNHVLWGNGSNIDGLYIGHYNSEAAETGNWFTVTDGAGGSHDLDIPTPAPQQASWAGEWSIYWFEIGPDGDTNMYFGAATPASSDEWDSETGNSTAEFPTTEANSILQTFRVGAHDVSGGGDTPVGSWGGYIGEQLAFSTILDATDRQALWTHLARKWNVTFNPGI